MLQNCCQKVLTFYWDSLYCVSYLALSVKNMVSYNYLVLPVKCCFVSYVALNVKYFLVFGTSWEILCLIFGPPCEIMCLIFGTSCEILCLKLALSLKYCVSYLALPVIYCVSYLALPVK